MGHSFFKSKRREKQLLQERYKGEVKKKLSAAYIDISHQKAWEWLRVSGFYKYVKGRKKKQFQRLTIRKSENIKLYSIHEDIADGPPINEQSQSTIFLEVLAFNDPDSADSLAINFEMSRFMYDSPFWQNRYRLMGGAPIGVEERDTFIFNYGNPWIAHDIELTESNHYLEQIYNDEKALVEAKEHFLHEQEIRLVAYLNEIEEQLLYNKLLLLSAKLEDVLF